MMHRDSTGVVQRIAPGAVNWMSAGRGIVHSERGPKDLQSQTYRNHGLQLWIALPEADEESAPTFQHVPADSIPQVRLDGAVVRVVVGSAFGAASPVGRIPHERSREPQTVDDDTSRRAPSMSIHPLHPPNWVKRV